MLHLQQSAVAERREHFLEAVGGGPELDKSSILPDKSRYGLLISDADGVVVESYLPEADRKDFERCGLGAGGLWKEAIAGTNGIDMALRAGRIVTVKGTDHYFRCFHNFACIAAPLHDAKANLIGTLTLVGSARLREEEFAWCEQVLRIAGSRFQARLFRKFHQERMTARLISRSRDRMQRFETIVACDDDGTILASLPLWRDGPVPEAHGKLEGRHLEELHDVKVTLRGPAMMPPRRPVATKTAMDRPRALSTRPADALARLAGQGGVLPVQIDRARKLAAHCIPLLVCGEAGVGQAAFVQAIIEDLGLLRFFVRVIDGTRPVSPGDFAAMLEGLRLLCESPMDHVPPTLVLHHVDRLAGDCQAALAGFLQRLDGDGVRPGEGARRPHLFFTAEQGWNGMCRDGLLDPRLLHLVGQAVAELPPLRDRERETVLAHLLSDTLGGRIVVSDRARDALLTYDWPGNLREMRSVLREAAICGNGRRINLVDLPERLRVPPGPAGPKARRETLIEALDSSGWNVSAAARLLGKSRATVNRWIAAEGLQRPD